MDGIILVDKKIGVSSYQAIKLIKKRFNTNKVGHCGTLDPFASGLLIIGLNQATKILPFLENETKEYIATITLGILTDTFDNQGNVIKEKSINKINKKQIEEVLQSFIGEIEQIPPVFSAIKVSGKHLYEYARNNENVTIPSRKVKIYELNLIDFTNDSLKIYVKCSKGTYIRTLGVDIANKLDNLGYLTMLRRIKIGDISVEDAQSYDDLLDENIKIIDIKDALNMKKLFINDHSILKRTYNGQKLILKNEIDENILICDNQLPIAIYQKKEEKIYQCIRGLYDEDYKYQRLKELQ